MELQYNVKTEVTQSQFAELRKYAKGICAFREESGKYFIKLLMPSYVDRIVSIIKNN